METSCGGSLLQGRLTMGLFIFTMSVYGLANAIAVLKIGRYFFGTWKERKFIGRIPYVGDIVYCPPCLAFWIGMLISRACLSPSQQIVSNIHAAMVLDGLMASGIIYLIHLVAERLGHGLDV